MTANQGREEETRGLQRGGYRRTRVRTYVTYVKSSSCTCGYRSNREKPTAALFCGGLLIGVAPRSAPPQPPFLLLHRRRHRRCYCYCHCHRHCARSNLPTGLHAYFLACLPIYLPACLPASLFACLSTLFPRYTAATKLRSDLKSCTTPEQLFRKKVLSLFLSSAAHDAAMVG